jgi:hypothetical protein
MKGLRHNEDKYNICGRHDVAEYVVLVVLCQCLSGTWLFHLFPVLFRYGYTFYELCDM